MFRKLKEKIEEGSVEGVSPLRVPPGSVIRSQQEGDSVEGSRKDDGPTKTDLTVDDLGSTTEEETVDSDIKTGDSTTKADEVEAKPLKKNEVRIKLIVFIVIN